jgi:exopolysaccharide production protein ExoZ
MNIRRIHSLDYLRGFMACAVMSYHYSFWTFGEFDSSTILGRLGLYGVSFFYILSGLTLYVVYKDYPISIKSVALFSVKRFFRIYPLLWIVTIIYIVALRITDTELLFLNLTGLFGFLKPEAYIGVGVWSIGNELVFYAFFPILIYLLRKNEVLFYFSIFLIFLTGVYFGFVLIDAKVLLEKQWNTYINPFNQFYLFAGGMLIGHVVDKINIHIKPNIAILIVLSLVIVFCFYPENGDVVAIVTNWPRIIFSVTCFLICFVVYASDVELNDTLHRFFSFLGATSYSIYLLHPIVHKVLKGINDATIGADATWILPFAVVGTLVASFVSYQYLEKPMIQVGAKVAHRIKSQQVIR